MNKTRIILTVAVVAANVAYWTGVAGAADQDNGTLAGRVETLEKQVQQLQPLPADHKPLWSSLDIQFYGYIKADAAYDSSRVTTGNYIVYVDNEASNNNDNEFNLTANETRLGFNFTGPKNDTMVTSGKVEFDFFGNYAEENKAKIQMRHAYMQFAWPKSGWSLLAGQTWDVISPLNPSTLNYTVLWDAGNIGYRRPQIRLTKETALAGATTLTLQGALAR